MLKVKLFILILFTVCSSLLAQQKKEISLEIIPVDLALKEVNKLIKYKTSFQDTLSLFQELNEVLLQLYAASYLTASIDSIEARESAYKVFLTVGESFRWAHLHAGNINEEILSKTGYRDKFFRESNFNHRQMERLFERLITFYENNGYPFAMIRLDNVRITPREMEAILHLEKNKLVIIDSIRIFGDSRISPSYLYNYLSIQPGDLYDENSIRKIGVRIRELPFLKESKPFSVAFTESQTFLNLYLEKQNANRFDGIVGVLPNEDDGQIELTGDIKLRLLNSFHRGELIDFNWRRLVNKSQDLRFKFNYPYLFNTPFGVDFDFKLYRRDTLFLDLYFKYGVQYMWKANNYFKVFVNDKNSNLLSTAAYQNSTVLPPFADISSTLYGVELQLEQLDYRLNPRKGFSWLLSAEVGTKKIKRNGDLNPVIYDGLTLNSNLYNFQTEADFYLPLTKSMVINLGNQSAYTFNENIFENELYRIGGLKILRGFDEESIFASLYVINTLEYRILLERNSYWYLFADAAYYENDNVNLDRKITDTPLGFGTGITFQTKSGIFSLSYALGQQFDNPIEFRAAKIHFGFINYF